MAGRIRAELEYARLLVPHHWKIALSALSIVVTIVGATSGSALGVVGFVMLVASSAAMYSDVREVRARLGDLYSIPARRDLTSLTLAGGYEDFERLTFPPHGVAITDDQVNAGLAATDDLAVQVLEPPYVLPRRVRWAHELVMVDLRRRGRRDFDDPKVRVASDFLPDRSWSPVAVQRTRYSYAAVTNEVASADFYSRERRAVELSMDVIVLSDDGLPSLAASECSNHVGVDVLAVTPAGRLVLQVQSVHNAQSQGLLASSGSGSADWADLESALGTGEGFLGFLRRAMARELAEECGLESGKVVASDVQLLGFARFLHRGGKPQFFGIMPVSAGENDLRRRRGERRYVTDHLLEDVDLSSASAFVARLRALTSRYRGSYSLPLHVNIELLARWMERDGRQALDQVRRWAPDAATGRSAKPSG